MVEILNRTRPNDWPTGNYTGRCLDCGIHFIGEKRQPICKVCDSNKPEIDYEKIHESKVEAMRQFKIKLDQALKDGAIIYVPL